MVFHVWQSLDELHRRRCARLYGLVTIVFLFDREQTTSHSLKTMTMLPWIVADADRLLPGILNLQTSVLCVNGSSQDVLSVESILTRLRGHFKFYVHIDEPASLRMSYPTKPCRCVS